jgi:predicted dehydrogenase
MVNLGIVGCGTISATYLKNLSNFFFLDAKVWAVSDAYPERAAAKAAEFKIARAPSVHDLLADPEIEVVVNLTVPRAHYDVSLAALNAGKNVYSEKPIATTLDQGESLVALARSKGLKIGVAPDTFLGAGIQTSRALIDSGAIGMPIGGTACMVSAGAESWHPDPEFLYKPGAGPVFDIGPYYITALVCLLGPVAGVYSIAKQAIPERIITSAPKRGTKIVVEVPTHVSALLDFVCGAQVLIVMSCDGAGGSANAPIEIYGTQGTIRVPDPDTFGGPVQLRRAGSKEWSDIPLLFGYSENSRGLGLADMARSLSGDGAHRASGALALHVLDVMYGMHRASETASRYAIRNTCERPGKAVF